MLSRLIIWGIIRLDYTGMAREPSIHDYSSIWIPVVFIFLIFELEEIWFNFFVNKNKMQTILSKYFISR